jgi:DNA-binding SARP family transcriptional activator
MEEGVELRILGPLEVVEGSRALEIGGARQRLLLARLAVSPNRVVSVEALVDELWAGEPPTGAKEALQAQVSRLRRALGGKDRLVARPPGYVLRLDRDELDASRFEALLSQGRTAAEQGQLGAAVALLREAEECWRGPALGEFTDYPSAQAAGARLDEARVVAAEERMAAELALGHHAQVVGTLEALVTAHPLRERLWGQLMVALYRAGRQAEALRAYQQLRRTLAEELGIEPSAELTRLEDAVLLQKPELDWHPPASSHGQNLPAELPSVIGGQVEQVLPPCPYRGLSAFREQDAVLFFGREDLTDRLVGQLEHRPLVALLGPSGSGKSSLLFAGAVPRLRRADWVIAALRPAMGASPLTKRAGRNAAASAGTEHDRSGAPARGRQAGGGAGSARSL